MPGGGKPAALSPIQTAAQTPRPAPGILIPVATSTAALSPVASNP
jgi:hypothetical protein